jgi:hypothetical protein
MFPYRYNGSITKVKGLKELREKSRASEAQKDKNQYKEK